MMRHIPTPMSTLYLTGAQTHTHLRAASNSTSRSASITHAHSCLLEIRLMTYMYTHTHTHAWLFAQTHITGTFPLHACGVTRNLRTYFTSVRRVFLVETVVVQTVLWDIRAWSARFLVFNVGDKWKHIKIF